MTERERAAHAELNAAEDEAAAIRAAVRPEPPRVSADAVRELREALWTEQLASERETDLARAVREFLDVIDGRGPR